MNYRIIATKNFEKQTKRLSKKFPSLKKDLQKFEKDLLANPQMGFSLGKNTYKIRIAVKSKGKGKSGGFRIITYLEIDLFIDELTNIYLLTIYDKSETENITNWELKKLIENKLR
ncbi:MAG: addiction module toxin RelE [Chlorobi bacterium]|nr:addiction module toxin RelE [Chlorobiota bacterium]MCI0716248.1 addiction module toxin RelE [Chlorobiota bacterium]